MNIADDIYRELSARRPSRERARQTVADVTDDRRIEWLTTAVIASLGVTLAFPGGTLANSIVSAELYNLLGANGETLVAMVMIGVAVARAMALAINGVRGRPTSLVRFGGAAVGAGLFSALSYTIALPWMLGEMPAPSTGMLTYAALAGADYVSAVRAARDARIYRVG